MESESEVHISFLASALITIMYVGCMFVTALNLAALIKHYLIYEEIPILTAILLPFLFYAVIGTKRLVNYRQLKLTACITSNIFTDISFTRLVC